MKKNWPSTFFALVSLAFVSWFSQHPEAADYYALRFYPKWSAGVSAISALAPVSLTEILVLTAVALVFFRLFRFRRHWLSIVNLLLWLMVWFYAGWGLNYFRSGIYERAGKVPAAYDEYRFKAFLEDYTDDLNMGYIQAGTVDTVRLANDIRSYYAALPPAWGLSQPRPWQEPKKMLLDRLYSGVGVQGFVGPFFNEIQVNGDVLPLDYPMVYAHEYAHLLGVSNEGEAQYWGYKACLSSSDPAVRHSARMGIFPYVANDARRILQEDDYRAWAGSLRPEILEQYERHRAYWNDLYWPLVGKVQEWFYNLYLKGNKVSSGTASYGEVVQLLITLDSPAP